jgi:hypothetical protein
MSAGEIYTANNTRNLAEWYPLFSGPGVDTVYTWAMWMWGIWLYIGLPMFGAGVWWLAARWKVYTPRGRALRLAVIIPAALASVLYIQAFHGASVWLFD